MNNKILEYQRGRALEWLETKIKTQTQADQLDQEIDALIRRVAGLETGQLYGFVQLPENVKPQREAPKEGHIQASRDTYIKIKPIASNYLKETEKLKVAGGTVLKVASTRRDKHQHCYIQLSNGREGYIYQPHWILPNAQQNKEVKLQVPYFYQRDNWDKYHGPGSRQCNATTHCMAAEYLLKGEIGRKAQAKGYHEPEDYYGEVLYKYGDTTDPQAHTPTYRDFGLESYFTYTASIKDLLLCLDKGIPVPIGVAYKASGHYVCAVGHKSDGVYIHDPFGTRMGQTDNYDPAKGEYDFVSWDWLQAKWVDQGSEAGWMRVVTAVKGMSTGIPGDL